MASQSTDQKSVLSIGVEEFEKRWRELLREYRTPFVGLIDQFIIDTVPINQTNVDSHRKRHQDRLLLLNPILNIPFSQLRQVERELLTCNYFELVDLLETILYRTYSTFRGMGILTEEVQQILKTPADIQRELNHFFHHKYGVQRFHDYTQQDDKIKPFKMDLMRAAGNRDVGLLTDLLKDDTHELIWSDHNQQSPLHVVVVGGETKKSIKFMDCLLTYIGAQEGTTESQQENPSENGRPQIVQGFLRRLNSRGQTVLHLAAENESVQIVKWLCSLPHTKTLLDIPDQNGLTPLQLMYAKTPKAVENLLDEAANRTLETNHFSDGNLMIRLDFTNVIGTRKGELNKNFIETALLASLVYGDADESSQSILVHPIVKIFLDLKWFKMAGLIYLHTAIYILIHLLYTLFVIQVFIISHPPKNFSATDFGADSNANTNSNLTLSKYLLGRSGGGTGGESKNLFVGIMWVLDQLGNFASLPGWDVGFLSLGIFLFLLELSEFYISIKMMWTVKIFDRTHQNEFNHFKISNFCLKILISLILIFTGYGNEIISLIILGIIYLAVEILYLIMFKIGWTKLREGNFLLNYLILIVNGFKTYFNNLENILQLIFIALMTHLYTIDRNQRHLRAKDYVTAAFGVILAYTLILLQFMNIFGFAKYIQILKTVIQSFLQTMLAYIGLLVAFCISFSILFYEDGLFETLPVSLLRVLPMMGGEFNWDDIFLSSENSNSPAAFYFPRHFLHASFNIVVTIVLINLLIGLTVGDITKILDKSQLVHKSIQLERLYIMENFVFAAAELIRHVKFWSFSVYCLVCKIDLNDTEEIESINLNEVQQSQGFPLQSHRFESIAPHKEIGQERKRKGLHKDYFYVIPAEDLKMSKRLPIKSLSRQLQKEIRDLLARNEDRHNSN